METTIDVIIPAYNARETLSVAIASCCIQTVIDSMWVTIIDDCGEEQYDDIVEAFRPFLGDRIRLFRNEKNLGPGLTRNVGIEHCGCTYFTCLDADDALYSPSCIAIMSSTMDNEGLDALFTRILEQGPDGEIMTPPIDLTWMHGKMYRTEFIKAHGIRFNGVRTSEEQEFNPLVSLFSDRTRGMELYTYMWLNNPKSITKIDPRFEISCIPDYTEALTYAMETALPKHPKRTKFISLLALNFVTVYAYHQKLTYLGGYPSEIERNLEFCKRYWKVCKEVGASDDRLFWDTYRDSYQGNLAIPALLSIDPRNIISVSQFIEILEGDMKRG